MTDKARYIIGVDLGTTNTAVAYVDTKSAEQRVQLFEVPQLVAPGELGARRQLPSFVYLASGHDLSDAETALPWDPDSRQVVGELARNQGARVSSRMIASAKSWLCHAGVDRNAAILPWGTEEGDKLSPVDASARVLGHVRAAWDHAHPEAPLADQELIVTVPASFDEAARELTVAAADAAGFTDIVLLEEPQAAFYAWIESHPSGKRAGVLDAGNHVLVFDIGGGTTDFTLIEVGEDGDTFSRTAVGDHLLLGGDNIDLTLAKQVEQRLGAKKKKKLDAIQWHGLVHSCRLAKETLLGDDTIDSVPISVAGRSSKLIGGAMRDAVERDELERTIYEGFFPTVEAGELPKRARGGLQEFGLPYAADPAVTRHLSSFLARHHAGAIDAVLFNGGAMTPESLRRRVVDQIAAWQVDAGAPRELANELPEMAVAKGAAYYGLVRRGFGARIRGGTPRTFYVGVGSSETAASKGSGGSELAVCLAARGLEDGSTVELDRKFALVTNRPVSFKLFSSTTRDDQPGDIVPVGDGLADMTDDDSDLIELPPIVTVLRARGRSKVEVNLQVRITELGALEIWCTEHDTDESWRLAFDMRSGGAAKTDEAAEELDPRIGDAKAAMREAFTDKRSKLPGVMKSIEKALDARRDEWSMTTTRALFDALIELEDSRLQSADHEQRWLNLAGFCLRPGNGAPLDQWRTKQMWRLFNDNLRYTKSEACRLAWWIVWRRIAGGMSAGQQEQIYDRLGQLFLPSAKQKKKWHMAKATKQEAAEMWRTLANLERLPASNKIKLGDELIRRMESKKGREQSLYFWALGRIGARVPLYGPLNEVVPAQRVNEWLDMVLGWDWPDPDKAAFPMAQLGRRTGDRSRDIDDEVRARLAARLRETSRGERMVRLVEHVVELEAREERVALGDTLPAGLRLVHDDE